MKRNDPQFYKMSVRSDLMRVAQSAGRLTNPESYDVWITFLKKALENMQKIPGGDKGSELVVNDLKNLIQPKEKILYDARTRLKWAEKVLDISCRLG
jgi:hypothetical protein